MESSPERTRVILECVDFGFRSEGTETQQHGLRVLPERHLWKLPRVLLCPVGTSRCLHLAERGGGSGTLLPGSKILPKRNRLQDSFQEKQIFSRKTRFQDSLQEKHVPRFVTRETGSKIRYKRNRFQDSFQEKQIPRFFPR